MAQVSSDRPPIGPIDARVTRVNLPGSAEPATYSHGILVTEQPRWLWISGQIGVDANGRQGVTFEEQAEIACRNLLAVLGAAEMEPKDLVRTTVYLTGAEDVAAWRTVRARILGNIKPAATLVIVSALASPSFMVEIDGVAARHHAAL